MQILISLCLFGTTMGLLAHFILIRIYGDVIIREPNPIILSYEIAGCLVLIYIALLGLTNAED